MDQIFLMDVLKTINKLHEQTEDYLPLDLVVFGIEILPQSIPLAMLHLDHYIQSYEVLLLIDQLVQRAI